MRRYHKLSHQTRVPSYHLPTYSTGLSSSSAWRNRRSEWWNEPRSRAASSDKGKSYYLKVQHGKGENFRELRWTQDGDPPGNDDVVFLFQFFLIFCFHFCFIVFCFKFFLFYFLLFVSFFFYVFFFSLSSFFFCFFFLLICLTYISSFSFSFLLCFLLLSYFIYFYFSVYFLVFCSSSFSRHC